MVLWNAVIWLLHTDEADKLAKESRNRKAILNKLCISPKTALTERTNWRVSVKRRGLS